ncbi:MAG: radical SAM protein, partial [Treponema sp.]|nr:radical SAM protein [Treponema sp.]
MKGAGTEIILIQPPMVQLNGPYPAPYYLAAFLEKRGFKARVLDHSIGLFERIFCRRGLELIFAHARREAESAGWTKKIRNIVLRFLSEEDLWLASVDRLTAFLRGKDREWGHLLSLANGVVPGGPRSDAFTAALGGEVPPDKAPLLASRLLEDLSDFITLTADSRFSLIRYLPTLSRSGGFGDFAAVEKSLGGFILEHFYRPFLEEEWDRLEALASPSSRLLLGLTIPFSGCLGGALFCAASAKARFGSRAETVAGGGYVNTELRFLRGGDFFRYFDHLSLDRGYGFLASLLSPSAPAEGEEIRNRTEAQRLLDDEAARTVFPDYSGVDFSRYLLPVDDANPMHRLWSDGRWLKAYL